MEKVIKTKDLKITFEGIVPILKDKTGTLSPQEVVSFSALLTFRGRSVKELWQEVVDKGQELLQRIRTILRKSSLRGHASMTTTVDFAFSFEGSKFLDSAITGLTFGSFLVTSGRRTNTEESEVVFPGSIIANRKAEQLYRAVSEKNINFLKGILAQGISKDEASKIMQYGVYGTGTMQFSVESLVALRREYEAEKKWMPEEMGFLIAAIEKELAKAGVDWLYLMRLVAPRNIYPYPNVFKDPYQANLARDLAEQDFERDKLPKIISANFLTTPALEARLAGLAAEIKLAVKKPELLKRDWPKLLAERQAICRDYNLAAKVKVSSRVAWRVWSEKKRHRTAPMVVESMYGAINRAHRLIAVVNVQKINERTLSENDLKAIDRVFSIPPAIWKNSNLLYQWLERAKESLDAYNKLVNMGIPERDAIFLIPRGLKIDVLQEYDLFNLITGYFPLRACATAEEEMRRMTVEEIEAIKKIMAEKGLDWLAEHLVPKCHLVGFCPEEKYCGRIKSLSSGYDDSFHQAIHQDLEGKFQKLLGNWEKGG